MISWFQYAAWVVEMELQYRATYLKGQMYMIPNKYAGLDFKIDFYFQFCLSKYLNLHVFIMCVVFFKWKRIYAGLLLLVYVCFIVGIPLTGLTPSRCWACPNPGHGCPTSYVVIFFVFNCLRVRGDVVRSVDMGGNVDYHCLSFLFITYLMLHCNSLSVHH
jgi:hypothetical protein